MIEDNLSDRGLFELELSENILSENEFSEKGLSEKDRLISVLKGKSVDRPPCNLSRWNDECCCN